MAGSACQRPDCHASAIQTGVMDSTSRSSPPPARQPANSRCVVAVLTTPNHYGYMLYLGLFVYLFLINSVQKYDTIRYDTRCYFNVRSKADIGLCKLNLPHGTKKLKSGKKRKTIN